VSTRTDARTAIRAAIRESLDASRMYELLDAETHASHGAPAPTRGGPTARADYSLAREWLTDRDRDPLEHFAARLEAVGGHLLLASSLTEASQVIGRILRDATARRVATSNSPLVDAVVARLPETSPWCVLRTPSTREIFDADVGISSAQCAIAESGTLVLGSDEERNRLVSLIPPIHIVLLHADSLRATLGEALASFEPVAGEMASRAITFITGPSRTADIEQMLVMGVHGPQMLYVVFIASVDRD
jgi:L-lactate dehydrogenase complex protein LldG